MTLALLSVGNVEGSRPENRSTVPTSTATDT